MGKLIDLVGKRFGRLTVLKENGRNKSGNFIWLCHCDCGKEKSISGLCLRKGDTRSCGCYNREMSSRCHRHNLTGRRFGRLIVIELVDPLKTGRKNILYRCLCDCGKEKITHGYSLQTKHVSSCGCLHSEIASKTTSLRKGQKNPNFGKHPSKETRIKVANKLKGIKRSLETRIRDSICKKGKNHPMFGKRGKDTGNWQGGKTKLSTLIRGCFKYRSWVKMILIRDNFTCKECSAKSSKDNFVNLEVHHCQTAFAELLNKFNITTQEEAEKCEALWDTTNGQTLCHECHKKTDTYFKGRKKMNS